MLATFCGTPMSMRYCTAASSDASRAGSRLPVLAIAYSVFATPWTSNWSSLEGTIAKSCDSSPAAIESLGKCAWGVVGERSLPWLETEALPLPLLPMLGAAKGSIDIASALLASLLVLPLPLPPVLLPLPLAPAACVAPALPVPCSALSAGLSVVLPAASSPAGEAEAAGRPTTPGAGPAADAAGSASASACSSAALTCMWLNAVLCVLTTPCSSSMLPQRLMSVVMTGALRLVGRWKRGLAGHADMGGRMSDGLLEDAACAATSALACRYSVTQCQVHFKGPAQGILGFTSFACVGAG